VTSRSLYRTTGTTLLLRLHDWDSSSASRRLQEDCIHWHDRGETIAGARRRATATRACLHAAAAPAVLRDKMMRSSYSAALPLGRLPVTLAVVEPDRRGNMGGRQRLVAELSERSIHPSHGSELHVARPATSSRFRSRRGCLFPSLSCSLPPCLARSRYRSRPDPCAFPTR